MLLLLQMSCCYDYKGAGIDAPVLVEADLEWGVALASLARYAQHNVRICRPVSLLPDESRAVCWFVIERLGNEYDLKNFIDLARYLPPEPPVPVSWRRGLLALGSGDPTRAICSTLIAQAFRSVRYPILPESAEPDGEPEVCGNSRDDILRSRHHSLFVPRDFDISPFSGSSGRRWKPVSTTIGWSGMIPLPGWLTEHSRSGWYRRLTGRCACHGVSCME